MGMLNPDTAFSSNMSSEMRGVVANFLSSPEGTLYVSNKPVKRIVRCRDLLKSAAKNEGMSPEEYLIKLRQPGKLGGLYGGGPELTGRWSSAQHYFYIAFCQITFYIVSSHQFDISSTEQYTATTHFHLSFETTAINYG